MKASLPSRWSLVFSLMVLGAVAFLVVTHPEQVRGFGTTLRSLSPGSVALAFALILAQVSAQALRMWAMVPRDAALSPVRAGYIFAVGDWTNIFVPARGGDALKIVLLTRPEGGQGMSLTRATGAQLADKVSDIGTLILLSAVAGLASVLLTSASAKLPPLWVVAGVAVTLLLLLAGMRRGALPWLVARSAQLRELRGGLSALTDPRRCLASVGFAVTARVLEVLALRVLCTAVGVEVSLPQGLLALVIVNVSTSVPVSVANLGVYEAGLAYGLTLSGVALPVAITIATTHHVLQMLGITMSAAGYALATRARPHRRQPLSPCAGSTS